MASDLKLAVVTGQHPHEVRSFQDLFHSFDGIQVYIQHMEDFSASPPEVRHEYDVVCFYNFHQTTPTGEEEEWFLKPIRPALEALGETRQGIVVGLIAGLIAVTLTESIGAQFIDAWGRWPLTIHSAGWGILFNLGLAHAQLGNLLQAIGYLEDYAAGAPPGPKQEQALAVAQRLRLQASQSR